MISGTITRAGGSFSDPNCLQFLISLALPLCVWFVMTSRTTTLVLAHTLTLAILIATLFSTWSRGGFIAVTVGLSWLLYKILGLRRAAILIIVFIIMAGVCIYNRSVDNINAKSVARSNSSRMILAGEAMKIFQSNWITGVGIAHIEVPITVLYKGVFIKTVTPDPKNVLLYLLDQLGISGGILFLSSGVLVYKILNCSQNIENWKLKSMWLIFAISSITDTPFGSIKRVSGSLLLAMLITSTVLQKNIVNIESVEN